MREVNTNDRDVKLRTMPVPTYLSKMFPFASKRMAFVAEVLWSMARIMGQMGLMRLMFFLVASIESGAGHAFAEAAFFEEILF